MHTLFFFLLSFYLQTLLMADANTIYDIRGDSAKLDANMTHALNEWRLNTILPIRSGDYPNVIINGHPENKTVSLTFDDSPDENVTGEILDVLKHYDVKSSFFMIGNAMADENATMVRRANEEGHLVLNHSFSHPHLTGHTPQEIADDLNAANERIHELTGKHPALMRPPYGSLDPSVVQTINDQGYTAVLWSLDSLDWAIKEKEAIIRTVIDNIRPGDIVLMHSGRSNHATAEALPTIIERLREAGYAFLTLDRLLNVAAYR